MPIIIGVAVVGGVLFLIQLFKGENDEESKTKKALNPGDSSPEFDVNEVRKLRRQLRAQMKAKKRSSPTDTGTNDKK